MLDSFASSRWQECYNWLARPLNDEHMACPLQSNNKRLSLESHLQMTSFILDSLSHLAYIGRVPHNAHAI